MSHQIVEVGNGHEFINLRSAFKIGGLIDIRTQASLVKLSSGDFILLDACKLDDEQAKLINRLTDDGKKLVAIAHLHPFHTVFAQDLHERFPKATLFGTARHRSKLSSLPWAAEATESEAFAERFADDFSFLVPQGVAFIPDDEKLHFASVLAFHWRTKTLHVDDTLTYTRLPGPLKLLKKDVLGLHPTLAKVLLPEAGAVKAFRSSTDDLIKRCEAVETMCAAHTHVWRANGIETLSGRVRAAVQSVESKLRRHEQKHG